MDRITNQPAGFQQTQTTRVKDAGPETNANPPPPPKAERTVETQDAPSAHPYRGQQINRVA